MESPCVYGKTKDKEKLYKAGHYLGIIGMFAVGAAVGGHLILLLHERTIWVSCGLLFVGFLLMFIKEELEEHPQILEEEQEIRKNIQNIREEAKEVENIIKDDLKINRSVSVLSLDDSCGIDTDLSGVTVLFVPLMPSDQTKCPAWYAVGVHPICSRNTLV